MLDYTHAFPSDQASGPARHPLDALWRELSTGFRKPLCWQRESSENLDERDRAA
jgi:hypothetical protein